MNEPKKLQLAKAKNGIHVKKGDRVAIIGVVDEILEQHGEVHVHVRLEPLSGVNSPLVLSPEILEKIG